MTDQERIATITQEAAHYTARGMEHLITGLSEGADAQPNALANYGRLANGLEVHFLFPNLDDRERVFLVELLEARRGLQTAMKANRSRMTPAELEQHDRATSEFQSRYVNARAELTLLNAAGKMTGMQLKILELEFLSLPGTPLQAENQRSGFTPRRDET